STHRLFSIAEKSAPGDGVFPREALEAAARALSRRFVGFDALLLARQHQTEVNALLLGALAASEVVPMTAADFEAAIREGGVALARLVDYQDARYAEAFLERVRRVRALDPGVRLTGIFARRLAVWMTYEDAIRVADLKTRSGRFERIRRENAAPEGAVLVVTD